MTTEEKQILRDLTPEAPANDLIAYIQDIVLEQNHPLSQEEKEAIQTKAEYWFMAALNKGYIICTDQIEQMTTKTLETDQEPDAIHLHDSP